MHVHARRTADEDPLLAREATRHRHRIAVTALAELVDQVPPHRRRRLVATDPLDLVRRAIGADGARAMVAAVERADRVAGNDADRRVLFLEILADAADGAARAGARHDMGDLATRLRPDLGASGGVVRLGIDLVVELIGEDRSRRVMGDLLRLHDIVLGMIGRHRRRRDHHLGAIRLEQPHLLLRHLVGHREDAAIPLECGRNRETDPGVAAGPLDNHPARLERAIPLRRLDDRQTDPVLHRATRIDVLRLAEDRRADVSTDPPQTNQGGLADGVEDSVVGEGMGCVHGGKSTANGERRTANGGWDQRAARRYPLL